MGVGTRPIDTDNAHASNVDIDGLDSVSSNLPISKKSVLHCTVWYHSLSGSQLISAGVMFRCYLLSTAKADMVLVQPPLT